MSQKPDTGTLFGIPYNFERPSVSRLIAAHWQPGERMLVEKPFGIGYTLNLANWRAWIALGIIGGLVYTERAQEESTPEASEEAVDVLVE
jgi:hypothetical protein